ncbi:uncharacterized protein C14orf119-like [Amphiura filiformis]|uniref:uncharacterized protein C14orf119-like n=1 Tax=Amphiura filiformis TaxID=82378 RepID=UPI003B223C5D
MALSVQEQEFKTVLHWFSTWSPYQRQDFMSDLVNKAVPPDVDSLFDSMKTLKVNDKPPSIFECQIKLFTDWFNFWSEKHRDDFIRKLGEVAPEFVQQFHALVESRKANSSSSGMQS